MKSTQTSFCHTLASANVHTLPNFIHLLYALTCAFVKSKIKEFLVFSLFSMVKLTEKTPNYAEKAIVVRLQNEQYTKTDKETPGKSFREHCVQEWIS